MTRGLVSTAIAIAFLCLGPACTGEPGTPEGSKGSPKAGDDQTPGQKPSAQVDGASAAGPAWLVWRDADKGFRTRWIAEKGEGFEVIAETGALVHARGASLVHIKRKDVETTVSTCACMEDGGFEDETCEKTGRINNPGLIAIDLQDGKETSLIEANKDDEFGEVYGRSLEIRGGVGNLLLVDMSDSGFYCGAHQSIGGAVHAVELDGKERDIWKDLDAPAEVRTAAAAGDTWQLYEDCESPEVDQAKFAAEVLEVSSLALGTKEGKVRLTWGLEAFVPYVCSPDYSVYGEGHSGMTPHAKSLGLAEPLPKGLAAALADLGDARTVGWARLDVPEDRREQLLSNFKALGDEVWPPENNVETGVDHGAAGSPQQQLDLGRKLTRERKYDEAIAALDAAIAADPGLHRAWAERGFAKLHGGDLDGAQSDCEKAYELDENPKFRGAIAYNLGLIAKKRGDIEGAKKHFRNSLGLRPNKTVQAALDKLEGAG